MAINWLTGLSLQTNATCVAIRITGAPPAQWDDLVETAKAAGFKVNECYLHNQRAYLQYQRGREIAKAIANVGSPVHAVLF